MRKALGLDVGDSKIGVAVSDGLGCTAQGITTFRRQSLQQDLHYIRKLIRENEVGEVVVGLPLKMNGRYSSQTDKIVSFYRFLKQHLRVPVCTWDERLTTVQAVKILEKSRVRRKKRASLVDTVAAALILQGYLDRQSVKLETRAS